MITVRNLTKRPILLNLDHRHACTATECTCSRMKVGIQQHDKKTGDRTVRALNKRIPVAHTLFAKGTKDSSGAPIDQMVLKPSVANLPAVKKLVASGGLKVEKYVPPTVKADGESPAPAPAKPVAAGASVAPAATQTTPQVTPTAAKV